MIMSQEQLIARVTVPAEATCFDTGIDIESGKTYRFSATGMWIDRSPPAVDADGVEHPGGIREFLNWAKRVPSAPWMALIGRTRMGHSDSAWFVIGASRADRTDLPAGRLMCCANDVLGFYCNNKDEIALEVFCR